MSAGTATGSEQVFLDTSALYETADRGSRRHSDARAALARLMADGTRMVITDLVIAELHGLTLGRVGPSHALAVVDAILGSPRIRLLATGPPLIVEGLEFVRARPGRRLSLVDATSFLVMRREGIGTAFALDDDFVAEGFAALP